MGIGGIAFLDFGNWCPVHSVIPMFRRKLQAQEELLNIFCRGFAAHLFSDKICNFMA